VDDVAGRIDRAARGELKGLTLKTFALEGEAPTGTAPARTSPSLKSV
jgi:hypothetical protein